MGDASGMKHHGKSWFVIPLIWLAALAPLAPAGETAGNGFPLRSAQPQIESAPSVPVQITVPPASPTPAVSAAGTQNFEQQPLNFSGDRRRARSDGRDYKLPSMWPGLLAVVVICGVFCVILYMVKKYLPGHRQLFSHPAMEVLGRTHLDQRRYVSLIRVGKRIVVVGVSPDEMRALSEITDEAEITGILEVARPKTEAGLTIFQRMFQRQVVDSEAKENQAMATAKALELTEQMSSIRERVREIREIERPAPTARRKLDRVG